MRRSAVHRRAVLDAESDACLAAAAAGGNADAFEELYRRHSPAAWGVAQAVVRNPDDAADAVGEAFSRVLRVLHERPERASSLRFRPYLLASTRHAAIDIVRRGSRVRPSEEVAGRAPASAAADVVVAREESALVARAFEELPERWRSALWLIDVERMSTRDAGSVLGVEPNNAAQLAARARSRLRERYLQAHVPNHIGPLCRDMVAGMGGYLAGTASSGRRAAIDAHVEECAECAERLAHVRDLGIPLRRALLPLPLLLHRRVLRSWSDSHPARGSTLVDAAASRILATPEHAVGEGWAVLVQQLSSASPLVERLVAGASAAVLVAGLSVASVKAPDPQERRDGGQVAAAAAAPDGGLTPSGTGPGQPGPTAGSAQYSEPRTPAGSGPGSAGTAAAVVPASGPTAAAAPATLSTAPGVSPAATAPGAPPAGGAAPLAPLAPVLQGPLVAGTDLTGAVLPAVDLSGVDFTGAVLTGADLTGADLQGAILSGADLTQAALSGVNLSDATLQGSVLPRADLRGANLDGAVLRTADLSQAALTETSLVGTDLSKAVLAGADLRGADLQGAVLTGANLIGADLAGADLRGADFTGAALQGTNLLGATGAEAARAAAQVTGAVPALASQLPAVGLPTGPVAAAVPPLAPLAQPPSLPVVGSLPASTPSTLVPQAPLPSLPTVAPQTLLSPPQAPSTPLPALPVPVPPTPVISSVAPPASVVPGATSVLAPVEPAVSGVTSVAAPAVPQAVPPNPVQAPLTTVPGGLQLPPLTGALGLPSL